MGISADPEVNLIQKAARGDSEAFSSLFDRYYPAVFNFALWLCSDRDQAEDLSQETFIRAYNKLGKLGPPWKVRPWLYQITRNLFLSYRQRQKPDSDPLDTDTALPAVDNDPENRVLQQELSGPVRSALRRMPAGFREVLVLREVEGFQYGDIAQITGLSLNNVKVSLFRARASFKDHYGLRVLMEDPLPDCDKLNELLDSFHDNELDEALEVQVRDHLKDCPTCQQRKRQVAALFLLFQGQPKFPPRADGRAKVINAVRRERARRRAARLAGAVIIAAIIIIIWPVVASDSEDRGGGGADQPPTATSQPAFNPVVTQSGGSDCACDGVDYVCRQGDVVLSAQFNSGQCGGGNTCECRGTTYVCPDGTFAEFNPACEGGGSAGCTCVCDQFDQLTKKCLKAHNSCDQSPCLP